jgi:hypothetical protein
MLEDHLIPGLPDMPKGQHHHIASKSVFLHDKLKLVPNRPRFGAVQKDVHVRFQDAGALFTPRLLTDFDVSVEEMGVCIQPPMV